MENKLRDLFMLGLIFLPLFSCPFTDFFRQESGNIQVPDIGPSTLNISANATQEERTDQLWSYMTNSRMEKLCLNKVREYAKEKGYPESTVFSCTCMPQETSEIKTFECTVKAIDGDHNLNAFCTKSKSECTLVTEQGDFKYTFDQIIELLKKQE